MRNAIIDNFDKLQDLSLARMGAVTGSTAVLLAGTVFSPVVAAAPAISANKIADCEQSYAALETVEGGLANLHYNSSHTVKFSIKAADMHKRRPDCDPAKVSRLSTIQLAIGKKAISKRYTFLRQSTDHGQKISLTLRTKQKISESDPIYGNITTTARSKKSKLTAKHEQTVQIGDIAPGPANPYPNCPPDSSPVVLPNGRGYCEIT